MKRIRRLAAVTAMLALPACGGSDAGAPAASDDAPPEWVLSSEPAVAIGVTKGEEAYELHRVVTAFRLSDGGIVVANGGTRELRYYDADGTHVRTVGGPGEGPGEFGDLRYARAIRGDTVVVWDGRQRRVSLFDEEGRLARDFPVDLGGHRVEWEGVSYPAAPVQAFALADGTLLFQPQSLLFTLTGVRWDDRMSRQHPDSAQPPGVYREPTPLFLVRRDGRVSKLGPFPATEWFYDGESINWVVFGHRFYVTAGGSRFFVGSGKPFAFRTITADGKIESVETGRPGVPVTRRDWDERVARAVTGFRDRDRMREYFAAMPRPDTMPSYSAVLADADDDVWAREDDWRWGGDRSRPQRWSVFSSEGEALAHVTVPGDFELLEVAGDRVLGLARSELGVETVVLHTLSPRPRDP